MKLLASSILPCVIAIVFSALTTASGICFARPAIQIWARNNRRNLNKKCWRAKLAIFVDHKAPNLLAVLEESILNVRFLRAVAVCGRRPAECGHKVNGLQPRPFVGKIEIVIGVSTAKNDDRRTR